MGALLAARAISGRRWTPSSRPCPARRAKLEPVLDKLLLSHPRPTRPPRCPPRPHLPAAALRRRAGRAGAAGAAEPKRERCPSSCPRASCRGPSAGSSVSGRTTGGASVGHRAASRRSGSPSTPPPSTRRPSFAPRRRAATPPPTLPRRRCPLATRRRRRRWRRVDGVALSARGARRCGVLAHLSGCDRLSTGRRARLASLERPGRRRATYAVVDVQVDAQEVGAAREAAGAS